MYNSIKHLILSTTAYSNTMQGDNDSSSQKEFPSKGFPNHFKRISKKSLTQFALGYPCQMVSRPFHLTNAPEGTVMASSATTEAAADRHWQLDM